MPRKKKRWIKAQVEQQVDVRSYAVTTEDGRLFRRNRRLLRCSREPCVSKDADVEIPSPILNCSPTEGNIEPEPTESTGHPTSSKQVDPGPQAIRSASPAECNKNSAVTRSGRCIRPLSFLEDYVKT